MMRASTPSRSSNGATRSDRLGQITQASAQQFPGLLRDILVSRPERPDEASLWPKETYRDLYSNHRDQDLEEWLPP